MAYLKERNGNLKVENQELRRRICLLEKLDLLKYSNESACMRTFQLYALKVRVRLAREGCCQGSRTAMSVKHSNVRGPPGEPSRSGTGRA